MVNLNWKVCSASAYDDEMPSARMGHTAVLVDARRSWGEELLIVHGGLNTEKQSLGDLAVLQVDSEAWFHPTTTNPGPPPRVFHCAAAQGGLMYVFGGHAFQKDVKGLHKYNDLWRLNTDNWEWQAVEIPADSARPCARDFPGMVALPGNRLLIFGGLDAGTKRLDDTWIFDCVSGQWSELILPPSPKPKARYGFSLARIDQRVLLFGGETATGLLNDVWILKGVVAEGLEQPGWMPLELPGEPPSARKAHTVAALGKLVVICGGHASEAGWFRTKTMVYHNDVTVMDRNNAVQWRNPTVGGEPPSPREYHTLTAVSANRALLFGGGDGKTMFSDALWLQHDVSELAHTQIPQGRSLMGQVPVAAPDELRMHDRTQSTASQISELSEKAAEELLSKLDGVQASEVLPAKVSDSTLNGLSLGPSEAPSMADPMLETLKASLGVPTKPAEPPLEARDKAAFQQVGMQAWQASEARQSDKGQAVTPMVLQKAARDYLCACKPEELRIRDLSAMIWDYRRSQRLDLPQKVDDLAALRKSWDEKVSAHSCQYCHLQAKNIRIGDVPSLHAQYKSMVSRMGGLT